MNLPNNEKNIFPFLYFIINLFILIFGFNLLTKGLFVDSVFYGAVAQNLSDGYGGWWELTTTRHHFSGVFYGHPPFAIWLMSFFMSFFDSAFWVERLFSIVNLIFLFGGMTKIWQLIQAKKHIYSIWWVALLWLVMPINIWSYSQYVLENTMTVFVVWSVYWTLKAAKSSKPIFYFFLAGIFLFLATLTKGPVGLFPLAAIAIYWLVFQTFSFSKLILGLAIQLAVLVGIYALLFYNNSPAVYYFDKYIEVQLKASLLADTPQNLNTLKYILLEPIVLWAIFFITIIINKLKPISTKRWHSKWALFFLLLFFSGTLPILISSKQLNFYIVPSLPFLALSLAIFSYPQLEKMIDFLQKKRSYTKYITYSSHLILVLGIGLMGSRYNSYSRDSELLADLNIITNKIAPNTKILIKSKEVNYIIELYLMREGRICANDNAWERTKEKEMKNPTLYLLAQKNENLYIENYYKKTKLKLEGWQLYKAQK